MQPEPRKTLAIVGAAGFVGQVLLDEFAALGIRATAIGRGSSLLAVNTAQHDLLDRATLASAPRTFDVVINLAYPNSGPPFSYPEQNQQIFNTVSSLLGSESVLIHVSTLAMFGMALDKPVVVGPVKPQRDHAYVETKQEAEIYFQKLARQKGFSWEIVRLGNVWGRASGAWVLPLVQKLILGSPVGVEGHDGYSNTTDVKNAASYLVHLAQKALGGTAGTGTFHHVAEFSHVRWSEWVAPLAKQLEVKPVLASPSQIQTTSGLRSEIRIALAPVMPRTLYQHFASDRIAGSITRTILRNLPGSTFKKLKGRELKYATKNELGAQEQMFLQLTSAAQQFKPSVSSDWTPPLNQDQSIARILDWLADIR